MDVIDIRSATPADTSAIAQVRVESWRTTYRGIVPDAYLDGMKVEDSVAWLAKLLVAGPHSTSVFVAEDTNGVVGFAAGNLMAEPKHGFDAELYIIYLIQRAQRTGVGARLVAAVAAAQRAHGATGLIVWVIAANRAARNFCEILGAEFLLEQPLNTHGMELVEAGYGWRDLDALVAAVDLTIVLH